MSSGSGSTRQTKNGDGSNSNLVLNSSSSNNKKTSLSLIEILRPMQDLHDSCENHTYEWRIRQLKKLRLLVTDHEDDWCAALATDLGKQRVEALCTELLLVQSEIDLTISKLKKWMSVEKIPSAGVFAPAFSWIQRRPLTGPAVLIIGPSNYPASLLMQPMIGAFAGGNPCVVKPSELTTCVEATFQKLIPQYFDQSAAACVTGGVPETTQLLQHAWGHIFFTGSARVGKVVAAAAAQTLTPVTLELGGKAPCYIDRDTCPSDLLQVANRIIWSKTLNAGQICGATDTVIIHEKLLPSFVKCVQQSLKMQFGENPEQTDFGRIVTEQHAERLVRLIREIEALDNKTTKLVTGGSRLCRGRYVAPTVIVNPPLESRIMQEEIFGPLLPIVTVSSRQQAIEFMRQMPGTPLCLYVFTTSHDVFDEITRKVPAGTAMRNDCTMHIGSSHIPFGGLGTSGYGRYHGKYSFECFTHPQPVMHRPCFPGADLRMVRFHPFGEVKAFLMTKVAFRLPDIPVLPIGRLFRALLIVVAAFLLLWSMGSAALLRDAVLYLAAALARLAEYL